MGDAAGSRARCVTFMLTTSLNCDCLRAVLVVCQYGESEMVQGGWATPLAGAPGALGHGRASF